MSERRGGLSGKVQRLRRQFFAVPWCVPALGWSEFGATAAAIASGRLVRGPSVEAFAAATRELLGKRFALPVNRGRTAIELALRALGVSSGDDVVIPAYVCSTAIDPILNVGATPVFADIEENLGVSTRTLLSVLTPRTKVAIVPHLFGSAAPIEEIEAVLRARGVLLIDDAAQSLGATRHGRLVGSFGAVGIVSSGPGKALSGPAGAVLVTDDAALFERARAESMDQEGAAAILSRLVEYWLLRRLRRVTAPLEAVLWTLGLRPPPHRNALAANVDATVALCQLRKLHDNAERRCRDTADVAAACERAGLHCLQNFGEGSVALKVIVLLPEAGPTARAAVDLLADAGIECQPGYIPGHLGARGALPSSLSVTDQIWERVLCLPTDTAWLLRSDPERVRAALGRLHAAAPTVRAAAYAGG